MMGMFDDMLDEGMHDTQSIMREKNVSYEEARRIVLNQCNDCVGTGWIGHGMGGDTCGTCSGTGKSS